MHYKGGMEARIVLVMIMTMTMTVVVTTTMMYVLTLLRAILLGYKPCRAKSPPWPFGQVLPCSSSGAASIHSIKSEYPSLK